jgi:hypothetical protein
MATESNTSVKYKLLSVQEDLDVKNKVDAISNGQRA